MDESDTELDEEDSASNAAAGAESAVQQRPPSTTGRVETPETSADIQLRSLLRDEFIIRQVFLFQFYIDAGLSTNRYFHPVLKVV